MDGKPAGMTANVPHGTIKFSRKEELCVAKIVAIANQKGGVGKTTTAVNLSSCVAALGKRVLIVDLDPQGNTTTGYGIPKRSVEKGTYEILIGEAHEHPRPSVRPNTAPMSSAPTPVWPVPVWK